MLNKVMNFLRDEEGASAVEYALIAGLIAVIIVAAVALLGTSFDDVFQYIADQLSGSVTPTT
ncbi:MAG TPA: Flp family type IVb pilin [Solimonas sp.]|jgi:pilus assembly protein Flp/PilA|nr:Flp family type IVb pilin [Solimonas sp.]